MSNPAQSATIRVPFVISSAILSVPSVVNLFMSTTTQEDIGQGSDADDRRSRYNLLIGWLIAFFTPIVFPFLYSPLLPLFLDTPSNRAEYPKYPSGISKYEDMTAEQKEEHSRNVQAWQAVIDQPHLRYYSWWIAVTVVSFLVFLFAGLKALTFHPSGTIGLMLLVPFYLILGFVMLIGWGFRHG